MDDKWALGGMSKSEPAAAEGASPPAAAPELPDTAPVTAAPPPAPEPPLPPPPPKASRTGQVLSFVVGLVAVAAIASSAWVYTETQRDIGRVATDIAQIKLSLELFGRQQPADAAAASGTAASGAVQDLANRLTILEESWRTQPTVPAALPALPDIAPTTTADGSDCLPPGMRLLVSAGDNYPICGVDGAVVDVASVANGFVTLSDGTTIAAGANIGLASSNGACMIGLMSSGDGGMTGFAEIRVTC